jgi:hypothetical protein
MFAKIQQASSPLAVPLAVFEFSDAAFRSKRCGMPTHDATGMPAEAS